MTKSKLWSIFVARNPSFEGDLPITLSSKGLRKLFDTTWDQAEKVGFENGSQSAKTMEDVARATGAKTNDDPLDAFKDMFGTKNNPFK